MAGFFFPIVYRMLGWLPLRVLHALGAFGGLMLYRRSVKYRRHMQRNLGLAYPDGVPVGLEAEAAKSAGRMMFEIPFLWQRPLPRVLETIREVVGWEQLEATWANGNGVLIITPHLGCWEAVPLYFGTRAPMTFMFRPPRQPWLHEIVEQGRIRPNLSPVPADTSGVRLLMRALKRGETVGILPDQVPGGGQGTWSPFFGRPAYTMTLAARLSEMKGVTPFVAYGERLPRGRGYRLHFVAPAVPLAGDLQQRVDAINASIEQVIRQHPEQYLWGYKRYRVPDGVERPSQQAAGAGGAQS
ncbi:MAG TPA: lysophospholipid acyltransferase family protein [Rhodocyclaceae bacterium]|nr:lysophospholipid acyltransferase family protein [Rhodocyclaceae bacterium]HNA03909.1 lysophospholipid acyltransferase family protein [Rhodocyclaceae bacterium]HNC61884.1 lysophospholipid acyltransferase family protein [Rhodocyclaceae bacterium]HNH99693.1 lysophospholipid acyltransferase family protein [Rhodocyclaceae bacterium]